MTTRREAFRANASSAITTRLTVPDGDSRPLEIFSTYTLPLSGENSVYSTARWMADLPVDGRAYETTASLHDRRCWTAITEADLIGAHHAKLNIGEDVQFVAPDGSYVERTVTGYQRIGSTDIGIAHLSSALPSSITIYPLPPADITDYLPFSAGTVPVVFGAFRGKNLHEGSNYTNKHMLCAGVSGWNGGTLYHRAIEDSESYWVQYVPGDSGNAIWLPMEDDDGVTLVLLSHASSTSTGYGYGPWYADYTAEITAACAALDTDETGFAPVFYDLGGQADYLGPTFRRRAIRTGARTGARARSTRPAFTYSTAA